MKSFNKNQNLFQGQKKLKKPLSLVFIFIYSAAYVIPQVFSAANAIDFMDFLYGFLIITMFFTIPLLFLCFILYIKNLKVSRKRKIGFGTGAIACIIIIPLMLLSMSLIKDQFTRAQQSFTDKNYEAAIKYYDYVIRNSDDESIIEASKEYAKIAIEKIGEAETFEKKGDIFFSHSLYGRAEENYRMALDAYPRLSGIKKKIKAAVFMKKEYGESTAGRSFVLFNENLEFKYLAGFAGDWGKTKICEPQLATFLDLIIERGKFFENENELKVSGTLKGDYQMEKYVESSYGLFVFLSAYVIDSSGNIKWSKDGYLNGNTPYIKENEAGDFSLTGTLSANLEEKDHFIIMAYIHGSMVLQVDPESPEGPNADRNVFAIYHGQIKDI